MHRQSLLKEYIALATETKWWRDPTLVDPDHENYVGREAKYARFAEDPEYKPLIDMITTAKDPKELARAKKTIITATDSGQSDLPDGIWTYFYDLAKDRLKASNAKPRSTADARADRMLRVRDSSGRAKTRK